MLNSYTKNMIRKSSEEVIRIKFRLSEQVQVDRFSMPYLQSKRSATNEMKVSEKRFIHQCHGSIKFIKTDRLVVTTFNLEFVQNFMKSDASLPSRK